MARRTQRKITHSTSYIEREDGRIIGRTYHNTFTISSEEDYVKIYHTGLFYMRDMPMDCMRLLVFLLPYVRYAEPPGSNTEEYGLTCTLDPHLKKQIAQAMGCKVATISNLLTELVCGEVLIRIYNTVYRMNPYYFGRGAVKDMGEMRALYTPPMPDDTFMSVYTRNKAIKKAKKEGTFIGPEEQDSTKASDPDAIE